MMLDFEVPGWVIIRTSDYIKMMLSEAPEDMGGKAIPPAAVHLFRVNKIDHKLLPLEKKDSCAIGDVGIISESMGSS